MREARAIVFDLDDTLYPRRRFLLSGFQAVAIHLASARGVNRTDAFRALVACLRTNRGNQALQSVCDRFDLSDDLVPALVNVIRLHSPNLRLPGESLRALRALRPDWRIGILTNGERGVQGRKVEALGLARLVDVVGYAVEYGEGRGKPDRAPFLGMLEQLQVDAHSAVFVGDDAAADIGGATNVGMRTIQVVQRHGASGSRTLDRAMGSTGPRAVLPSHVHGAADAWVSHVRDVPVVAARLVRAVEMAHVV